MVTKKKKTSKKKKAEKTLKQIQIEYENKLLRNIFIGIGIVIVLSLLAMWFYNNMNIFEYKGVEFERVLEGDIIFYRTSLPVIHEGKNADYNFYIRNDPRDLDKIPFTGQLQIMEEMVVHSTDDFHCDGYGIIAIANLAKLYDIIGTKVIRDENATCDPFGRYVYLNIQPGNETRIEHQWPRCYNIYIKDCEILEGTEKFMVETFVEVNKKLDN